ncbi:unnamed protein product [Mesocestoides corti]|uniref:Transmembrane protein n=1 Tax=Mesocestoides corti TaxID=53468 RepID=A0A158QUM6_MESCO|nr:unnamed protein product [Mesocestoides corti]
MFALINLPLICQFAANSTTFLYLIVITIVLTPFDFNFIEHGASLPFLSPLVVRFPSSDAHIRLPLTTQRHPLADFRLASLSLQNIPSLNKRNISLESWNSVVLEAKDLFVSLRIRTYQQALYPVTVAPTPTSHQNEVERPRLPSLLPNFSLCCHRRTVAIGGIRFLPTLIPLPLSPSFLWPTRALFRSDKNLTYFVLFFLPLLLLPFPHQGSLIETYQSPTTIPSRIMHRSESQVVNVTLIRGAPGGLQRSSCLKICTHCAPTRSPFICSPFLAGEENSHASSFVAPCTLATSAEFRTNVCVCARACARVLTPCLLLLLIFSSHLPSFSFQKVESRLPSIPFDRRTSWLEGHTRNPLNQVIHYHPESRYVLPYVCICFRVVYGCWDARGRSTLPPSERKSVGND